MFIKQISALNTLNMLHNLRFFYLNCRLFHNSTLFGSCIIHILNTGVLKFKRIFQWQRVNNLPWLHFLSHAYCIAHEVTLPEVCVLPATILSLQILLYWLYFLVRLVSDKMEQFYWKLKVLNFHYSYFLQSYFPVFRAFQGSKDLWFKYGPLALT
jgi:hypothetical protein